VALFDALVERIEARARTDPSIAVINQMPTVFSVSRHGSLLTLSQGIGLQLVRGDLKWQDGREKPRPFHIRRAATRGTMLVIAPLGIEGTADEILERVVAIFFDWTEPGERPMAPSQESQPANRPPRRAPSSRSTKERQSTVPVPLPDSSEVGKSVELTAASPVRGEEKPQATTANWRTYQLLFETARREFELAKALPSGSSESLIEAGVFVALAAEAFFNDLGSRTIPSWPQLDRLDIREKADVLSLELFNTRVDWNARPFQSVAAAFNFTRALTQAQSETVSFDRLRTAARSESGRPVRTIAWREYCDFATIQMWIADVPVLVQRFSEAHDSMEVAVDASDQSPRSSSNTTRRNIGRKRRPTDEP